MKIRRFIFLASILSIFGCGKIKNSSTVDAASASGSVEFVAAKQILTERCLSCHSNWTSYSESDFLAKNLIKRSSAATSSLYIRIRGNDAGVAGDMPQGQSNLTYVETRAIKDWINAVK